VSISALILVLKIKFFINPYIISNDFIDLIVSVITMSDIGLEPPSVIKYLSNINLSRCALDHNFCP